MKRMLLLPLLAVALPLAGQPQASVEKTTVTTTTTTTTTRPENPGDRPVATVNGETITAARLDALYDRLGTQMREQYEQSGGGKAGFLANYIGKRLLVQEAIKSGFDKRPEIRAEIQAATESAIFDRYVRDVVAANIVTEAELKKYYDEHPDEFKTEEKVKVRHIVIIGNGAGPHPKTKQQALDEASKAATELHGQFAGVRADDPEVAARIRLSYFAEAAKRYSEDGSAATGGDLGWVNHGMLDPDFEAAAFKLPVGLPSGIVETKFGYHIILVEAKKPAGVEPFESVKPKLREYLTAQHASDIMLAVTKLTNEVRGASKIAVYPENIK